MNINDLVGKFQGTSRTTLTQSAGGETYSPTMLLRPLLGIGNAPQYALEAQQVALASLNGGGTFPVNPAPSAVSGPPLDFARHMSGGLTAAGTMVDSRNLDPLILSFTLER